MIRKALIIGAQPSEWEGPWVSLMGGSRWEVVPEDDYRGRVAVEVKRPDRPGPVRHLLDGEAVEIEGTSVRGVILPDAQNLEVQSISVNIQCRQAT